VIERGKRQRGVARTRARPFASWLEQHGWGLMASVRRLGARPMGTLMTVSVMGFALALPLTFALLLGNLQHFGATLGQTQAISVFMQPGVKDQAAQELAGVVRARSDVASVGMRTPKQGMAELAAMQGFGDALKSLDYNPLPYVLVVHPAGSLDTGRIRQLVGWLHARPGVDLVQDDGAWRSRLQALLDVARRAVLMLAALLATAALLVVGNSVRLDIQGRAEEIAVLRLVGASASFVRRPYLYAGLWYGLAGGLVAVLLTMLLEWALAGPVERLVASYGGQLQLAGLPVWQLALVPALAALLGWLGARLVCARQLRRTV